ncbi:hypothetical protein Pmani_026289 [Petrolisthes manimaculis]|uniref:Secreted protein n=1 Tax=Petrolisthes manimaculis TaxID=1843537 RepID=A0AAE1P671_9EUCA|nr:hypothetical protein Pmani_026289 [Petrolisthes manimaculis]
MLLLMLWLVLTSCWPSVHSCGRLKVQHTLVTLYTQLSLNHHYSLSSCLYHSGTSTLPPSFTTPASHTLTAASKTQQNKHVTSGRLTE